MTDAERREKARLRSQRVALRQAIDLYRDRNQGPILDRAKTLFAKLTDGVYSGLRADVDDKDEAILIAEHPTRGSLGIKALSDGTFTEGEIGRHDDGGALIELADQIKQQLTTGLGEGEAKDIAAGLPKTAWKRLSAGPSL